MDDLNSKLVQEKIANKVLQEENSTLQGQINELKQQLRIKDAELGKKDMELKSLKQRGNSSPQASINNGRPEPKVECM